MKIKNSNFGYLPKKSHLIILIISVLILQNIDSLNLFKISTDKSSAITKEKKVANLIDINIHISSNKEIKVNGKAVKLLNFKKAIWELTNKYSTQKVSGFIYNVYASNTINMGFITDLFNIIETTQDYNFSIKQVLHHYN